MGFLGRLKEIARRELGLSPPRSLCAILDNVTCIILLFAAGSVSGLSWIAGSCDVECMWMDGLDVEKSVCWCRR